jgi:RNA-directed DNA polymerase
MPLKPTLERPFEEARLRLRGLTETRDVADLLEVPVGQLLHILYVVPDRMRFRSFELPKRSGGSRRIDAPIGGTAILLRKLLPLLTSYYRVKPSVHGFVVGRSVKTNAAVHVRKRHVLNVDLEGFYQQINFGRIRGLFIAEPFCMGDKAASVVAHLCCFRGSIPQGSPTSPVLSNLVCADLDRRIAKLARKYHLNYTRYADDLTLSTNEKDFPVDIARAVGESKGAEGRAIVEEVLRVAISNAGFSVNPDKVSLRSRRGRQSVTGLTVNAFPNPPRSFVRRLRAMLFAWEKYGVDAAGLEHFDKYSRRDPGGDGPVALRFRAAVWGNLAYLKQIRGEDDTVYTRLALWAARLDPTPPVGVNSLRERNQMFDVFISHASEDKQTVARPIYEACLKAGMVAFLDEEYIKWGDSLTEKINHALGRSKLLLAVLSEHSVGKAWPAREVNAALAREMAGKQKVLPLLVRPVDTSSIPLVFDKIYVEWSGDADGVAEKLQGVLRDDK